nr:MAG TPA: hypothetical protein [Caudoviricetes sp.]
MCCPADTGEHLFFDQQPECTSRAPFAYFCRPPGRLLFYPEP